MTRIAVIGAGPMGLAACHQLLKLGHEVVLFEKDDRIGGMTASFDFDGLTIERYYHFICRSDQPLFDLLSELGIGNKLQWRDTFMGYYHNGKLHDWGDLLSLLKFPALSLGAKLRYGLLAFSSIKRSDWSRLDKLDAVSWIKKWIGPAAYDVLWKPLFELKFHKYTNNLSAAWIWTRLKRTGTSRRHLFQESLGYLDGGSDTLLQALEKAIADLGGEIRLNTAVSRVTFANENSPGKQVHTQSTTETFDQVISTIPLPYVSDIFQDLPTQTLKGYQSVENIAVVCVLAKLRQPVSKYFWLNISDEDMDIPGLVEYSQLCPLGEHLVYAPYYLPGDHPKYQEPNGVFVDKVKNYIKQINPNISDDDFICVKSGRYRFAQPICPPQHLNRLPSINPGVRGLFIADTSYYYPEDRSISESVKLGQKLATMAHACHEDSCP